jgi:hypothetical protein
VTAARLRPLAVGGGLVLLLALVALAASGRGPTPASSDTRTLSGGVLDALFTLGVLGMLLTLGLLIWTMRVRREGDDELDLRAILLGAVAAVVFFLLVAGGAYLLSKRDAGAAREQPRLLPSLATTQPGSTRTQPDVAPAREAHVSWPAVVAVLAGVGVLVAATSGRLWWSRRRQAHVRRETVDAVREVLERAIAGLDGSDPRRAVIAAYAHMERTLALHGIPRAPSEAPLEYMRRALVALDASAGAVHDLTELFERARFSEHDIGEPERVAALRSLAAVRDELREEAA